MIFLGNTNMDLRTDSEVHYLYINGTSNVSTKLFSEQYHNVYQVDLCYFEANVSAANSAIVIDIEQLRTPFTDDGTDASASNNFLTSSKIRGFFATIPSSNAAANSRRVFKEKSDWKYSVQYKNPVSFDKLNTRILTTAGALGPDKSHEILLRVHCGNPNKRPQMPVDWRDENNQLFEGESLGLLGN